MNGTDSAQPRPTDLPVLTSLRFFAALWVVVYHFHDQLDLSWRPLNALLSRGPIAVDFFFVLSGFILTHVYGSQVHAGTLDTWDFLRKRLARIYPLHLLTMAALIGLWALARLAGLPANSDTKYDFYELPKHLLLIHAWGATTQHSWNIPSWSISAEWLAYILFPVVARAILALRPIWAVSGAFAALAATIITCELVLGWRFLGLQTLGIVRVLPEFTLGIALHAAWRHRDKPLPGTQTPGFAVVFFTVVVGLAAIPDEVFDSGYPLLILLAVGVPAFASLRDGWLTHPTLQALGHASFSLYMIHGIIQTVYFLLAFKAGYHKAVTPGNTLVWLMSVLVSVAASVACYRFVEAPLLKRLSGGRRRT